jgi:hypothetical protein
MTPVWIAITGLSLAVVTLVVTLVTHLVVHAYKMGQRDQRILALENRPHDSDCATQLAALNATLAAFKTESERRMDAVEQGINTLRGEGLSPLRPAQPSRRRAAQ